MEKCVKAISPFATFIGMRKGAIKMEEEILP